MIVMNEHPDIRQYLKHFHFHTKDAEHTLGWLDDSRSIMVQTFTPSLHKGTILLLHGYLDHVGVLRHMINFLLSQGFQIITYDLPGHGLSVGPRHHIDHFSTYVDVLHKVLDYAQNFTPQISLIAHSTGAAISLTYLTQFNNPFSRIIWAAPLIRSYGWLTTRLVTPMLSIFCKNINRISSKRDIDPYQGKAVPTQWIQAMLQWNTSIIKMDPLTYPILILQGDQDRTVDWKYNLQFLNHKFPRSHVEMIRNGKHQLFNDTEEVRGAVFERILRYLQE